MENETNLFLQNQKNDSTMMMRPVGTSIMNPYVLDVVERLGKYEFIYDYEFGGMQIFCIKAPCPSGVDSTKYSKGNVVNVIRFQGNIAVVENPNYVQPNPNAPKVSFWASLSNLKNEKEFNIPKEYLSKVDDSTPITVNTGINFGANPKPQAVDYITTTKPSFPSIPNPFVNSPIKPRIIPELDNEVVLEQNATFVLNSDFNYVSSYGSSYCSPSGLCTMDLSPKYSVLKAGSNVTGRLIRKPNNIMYKMAVGATPPPTYIDFLDVKGYGDKGRIEIPIEYLTKEIQNNTTNNDGFIVQNNTSDNIGTIVPVKNNNNNLLMIAGAFLAGYIVFGNSKSSN